MIDVDSLVSLLFNFEVLLVVDAVIKSGRMLAINIIVQF